MPEIDGINVPFMPVGGAEALKNRTGLPGSGTSKKGKFDEIFQEELLKLKFSAHAMNRLESRSIDLTDSQMTKLNEAVNKAKEKGSKEALVLMDEQVFIVSIQNNTVITVFDKQTMEDNVISNIDSAVFAK